MISIRAIELSSEVTSQVVLLFATVGLAISTLEFIALGKEFRDNGIFAWSVIKTRDLKQETLALAKAKDILYGRKGTLLILFLRLTALLIILFFLLRKNLHIDLSLVLLSIVLATMLLLNYRCTLGADGSDQMLAIIFFSLTVDAGLVLGHSPWKSIGLWFIALQSCLSYEASGISKLWSAVWRSGDATFQILNTVTYGSKRMAELLRGSMALRKIACWSVIGFECVFPCCLILPTRAASAILILGIGFHVFNAIYMGLNVFLWAYVATYPAILFCAAQARSIR